MTVTKGMKTKRHLSDEWSDASGRVLIQNYKHHRIAVAGVVSNSKGKALQRTSYKTLHQQKEITMEKGIDNRHCKLNIHKYILCYF